jgi:hypothetical protein
MYTNTCCEQQGGLWGNIFELFSLKSEETNFSENRCTKSITNTTGAPATPLCRSLLRRIKYISFLCYCPLITTVRVITNTVRKLLIITRVRHF